MSLKDKVKELIESISSKLITRSTAIDHVININNRFIETELKLIKDLQDGIIALKNYADTESIELESVISEMKLTFKSIEKIREEKIEQLKNKVITPLQEILDGYNALTLKFKEVEKARRAVEKEQRNVVKKQKKTSPGDLEEAQFLLKDAQSKCEIIEEKAEEMSKLFNKEKTEKIFSVLKSRIDVEKEFFKKALETIESVIGKSNAFKIVEKW